MTCVEQWNWDRAAKLRACACMSSGILTFGKEIRRWAVRDNFVGRCGVFALQMDVTVLTVSRVLRFNLIGMRPQTLKMCQERFLTKKSFFARSAHKRFPRILRAPNARCWCVRVGGWVDGWGRGYVWVWVCVCVCVCMYSQILGRALHEVRRSGEKSPPFFILGRVADRVSSHATLPSSRFLFRALFLSSGTLLIYCKCLETSYFVLTRQTRVIYDLRDNLVSFGNSLTLDGGMSKSLHFRLVWISPCLVIGFHSSKRHSARQTTQGSPPLLAAVT